MKRQDLFDKVAAAKMETKNALQTMYDALNQGQRKKIVRNEDGSVDYDGQHFKSEYSFMESDYYYVIDDDNASAEYIESFAEVEQKELGNNVIMSIYRGDRW